MGPRVTSRAPQVARQAEGEEEEEPEYVAAPGDRLKLKANINVQHIQKNTKHVTNDKQ